MSYEKQQWRFFVTKPTSTDDTVTIDNEEHHYLKSVLRLSVGMEIQLADGHGWIANAHISEIGKKNSLAKVFKETVHTKPKVRFGLLVGQTKPQTLDDIVYLASELGADHISIVKTQKCQSKAPLKMDKLQKISLEALRISKGAFAPSITHFNSVAECLNLLNQCKLTLFCDETDDTDSKSTMAIWNACEQLDCTKLIGPYPTTENPEVLVVVGPEGSFTAEERNLLLQSNTTRVTLGSTILRTSTAVSYSLAICAAKIGLLNTNFNARTNTEMIGN